MLRNIWLFVTPWAAACQASLSINNSWSLLKLMSIKSVNAIQPSHPLSSLSPPTFSLSQHQDLFQGVRHQVAKVLEFQLQRQSFQWIFRTEFLWDSLVWSPCSSRDSQEPSKHDSPIIASILWRSAFFIVQLSHPYMTTGKAIALTRWAFVDKVMSLPFNMLSRLVIAFLPRSKLLLISWRHHMHWFWSPPPKKKIKSVSVSTVSPSIYHKVLGLDDLHFLNVEF